jgi:hypothetical protein
MARHEFGSLIYVHRVIDRESNSLKRQRAICRRAHNAPFDGAATIFSDGLLDTFKHLELIAQLIEQIINRRGIGFSPRANAELDLSGHETCPS